MTALTAETAIAPGAPLLRGHRTDGGSIELVMKGGQMGPPTSSSAPATDFNPPAEKPPHEEEHHDENRVARRRRQDGRPPRHQPAEDRFDIAPVEVAEAGRARLKAATGLDCIDEGQALSRADVVLMAVPDRMIGEIAHKIVPKLDPGSAVIVLDAAAPHAGEMPSRADVTYFVTHPCHPPIFNDETDPAANSRSGFTAQLSSFLAAYSWRRKRVRCRSSTGNIAMPFSAPDLRAKWIRHDPLR